MSTQKYNLSFLPLFEEDLDEITDYIASHLHNPDAALRLIDDIEIAINKRLETPLAFAPYPSSKTRPHPYYRINVLVQDLRIDHDDATDPNGRSGFLGKPGHYLLCQIVIITALPVGDEGFLGKEDIPVIHPVRIHPDRPAHFFHLLIFGAALPFVLGG